jgi:hypothetical protein
MKQAASYVTFLGDRAPRHDRCEIIKFHASKYRNGELLMMFQTRKINENCVRCREG